MSPARLQRSPGIPDPVPHAGQEPGDRLLMIFVRHNGGRKCRSSAFLTQTSECLQSKDIVLNGRARNRRSPLPMSIGERGKNCRGHQTVPESPALFPQGKMNLREANPRRCAACVRQPILVSAELDAAGAVRASNASSHSRKIAIFRIPGRTDRRNECPDDWQTPASQTPGQLDA